MSFLWLLGSLHHKIECQTSILKVNLIFFHKCFGHIVVLTNSKAMCKFRHKNMKIDKNSTSHNSKASVQKVRYKHFAWAQFLIFLNRFRQVLILQHKKRLCKFQSHRLKITKKCHFCDYWAASATNWNY